MTAEANPDPKSRRPRFRDEVWGDEPQEVDATEFVEELQATRPELAKRWHDHPTFVPLKVVGRFIRRSGKRVAVTIAGFVLLGWLLIIPGLALLATEYVWAQRLLRVAKEKAVQAKEMVFRKKAGEKADEPES